MTPLGVKVAQIGVDLLTAADCSVKASVWVNTHFRFGECGISLTIKSAGILTGGNRGAAFNTRVGITRRF